MTITKKRLIIPGVLFLAGIIIGAGVATYALKDALRVAQSERTTCVDQLNSYQADSKAEVHRQLQTFSQHYLVFKQDAFIDILNGAQVDLEKEYFNLNEGQFPVK